MSGNRATFSGGGIFNSGTSSSMTLTNSTVTNNTAGQAGGGINNGGSAILRNTIVAGNTADTGPDAFGTFSSQGTNLIGNTSGAVGFGGSDNLGRNPLLGPLQDNGGPTDTHALLSGSPAIDRATNTACPPADQRGVARFQDGDGNGTQVCDIGYFEVANTPPTITNLRPAPGSEIRDRTPLVAATVRDAKTNLAKTNIRLFVDGNRKTTFTYNASTDRLTYTSGRLSFGKHTVRIEANDLVHTTTRSWSFKVVT